MSIRSRREGFAIPMALLLLGAITAGVVGAFVRLDAEQAVLQNRDVSVDAYALAEAGMAMYVASKPDLLGVTGHSATLNLAGGTAAVEARRVRPDDGVNGALFLVRSTGQTAGPSQGRHTVAQFAWYKEATLDAKSSWTAISGLIKNGEAGQISGVDRCGAESTLAGVAVPTGGFSGKDGSIYGEPPIQEMGTSEEMAGQINIDWDAIKNGDQFEADYTIPPDNYQAVADTIAADSTYWPIIRLEGNQPLPGNGRGLLIVEGDLTLNGGDRWEGIILTGGRIVDNGSGHIEGAVISGLNVKLGEEVGQSSRANGTKDYLFNSCMVRAAAGRFSTLIPLQNTWVDNWAEY